MGTAGRAYVLSAAVALAAMVGRTGWIDWQAVGHAAVTTVLVAAGLLTVMVVVVLVVAVSLGIVMAVLSGLLKLVPARPTREPPA